MQKNLAHIVASLFTQFFTLFATLFIAGCAINTPATTNITKNLAPVSVAAGYQGRMSILIASDPPQSLYSGFTLQGDALTGELKLSTPLGTSLAQLNWTPQTAILFANGEVKEFASASALLEKVTGTAIPLRAMFDWLAGNATPIDGWDIDLSQMKGSSAQRLIAKRNSPLPAVELRIALEQQ